MIQDSLLLVSFLNYNQRNVVRPAVGEFYIRVGIWIPELFYFALQYKI